MIKEYQDLINNYSEWLKQKIRIESIILFRQYRENRRVGRQLQGVVWNVRCRGLFAEAESISDLDIIMEPTSTNITTLQQHLSSIIKCKLYCTRFNELSRTKQY